MIASIGIDIGSTSAKTVALDEGGRPLLQLLQPTGWSSADTAQGILTQLQAAGIDPEGSRIVATGYGRISVPYAHKCVTEISCHARGAAHLTGLQDLNLIDIGGQDTKLIAVRGGAVRDFLMNDKCSAGTGRFLEVMANSLGLTPEALCNLALEGRDTTISSMCTVFAESEVISLIGKGEKRENIAFAVVDSIVRKVAGQAGRLALEDAPVYLTGGLCNIPCLSSFLTRALGRTVEPCPNGHYAGAVGAALYAAKLHR